MPYPSQPAALGDLVVGHLASRSWRRLTVGADGAVLVASSLDADFGMEWTNTLGVKTFESDLTLTDIGPGAETTVFRTNASGHTSIVNSDTNKTIYFGGHTASTALTFSLTGSVVTFDPSSGRGLYFNMDAARELRVRHGATDSFIFNAGSNQSHREFRQYHSAGVGYGKLTADASSKLFVHGNHAQKYVYLASTTTSLGLSVRDDGGSMWLETQSGRPNLAINLSGTGGTFSVGHNYSTKFYVQNTAASFNVPTTFNSADAVAGISYGASFAHQATGANPVAGFGGGALFQLHDGAKVLRTAAAWEVLWEDPTTGSYDAAIQFRAIQNSVYPATPILYLSGLNAQATVGGKLKVTGNVGFNNLGPIAIPTAYTQTYATATRTHANQTQVKLTDGTTGTPTTTINAVSGTGDDTTINDNGASLVRELSRVRADVANLKQVVTSLIDDGQAYGLLQ